MMIKIDYKKVSEHLWKFYEKECKEIIKTADDAVEKRFIFNQRWDMERTYKYVKFPHDIDFLHQPENDPEWTFAFNRLKHFNSLSEAYRLTGDKKYLECLINQIRSWIETVREDDEKAANAWRTIETGIRLDTLSKTWLLIKDENETKEIEPIFLESISRHAESILSRSWNSYHLMSNWGVLSNHGLYSAGVIFGNKMWEKEALRRLSLELDNEVYNDGMQWEQSPMYHNEVTREYLDVLCLSRWGNEKIDTWFYNKVHKMALVNLKSIKPDGTEPLMGDSDEIDMRDIITLSAYIFHDPNLKSLGYKELDVEPSFLLGIDAIDEYRKIDSTLPSVVDYFLSDSGNGYARTSWNDDSDYLRFHCGTLGAGHGHSDQTHISFSLGGKDFLTDSGRFTYVKGDGRFSFKNCYAHNVVVVDKEPLYPEKDSWECYKLSRSVNVRHAFINNNIVAFEGGHLGYYEKGIFLNRRVLWLKKEKLLFVIDESYARGKHSYEQIFHFSEDVDLNIEKNSIEANNVRLYQLSTSNLSFEKKKGYISRHYNQREENNVLYTKSEADGFFSLWTVFDLSGEDDLTVERSDCQSNFKNITFPSSTIESVLVKGKEREIVLVAAHTEFATPTDTFNAFGRTGFGNLVLFPDRNIKEIGIRIFA